MLKTVTKDQMSRVIKGWSDIAGEKVTIEATEINAPIYAFGSELACLRLFYKLGRGRAEWSENLNTFYYCNQ